MTAVPGTDVSGNWHATISLSSSCTNLPADAATRQYDVVITQRASQLVLVFTAPDFVVQPGGGATPSYTASGVVSGASVSFGLKAAPDLVPPLFVEQLGPGRWLGIDGQVSAGVIGDQMSGPISGWYDYWEGPLDTELSTTLFCRATDNRVVLVRQ